MKLAKKVVSSIAILGLTLVLCSFLVERFISSAQSVKFPMMVVGFTMMLLGTIWKVVIEMREGDD